MSKNCIRIPLVLNIGKVSGSIKIITYLEFRLLLLKTRHGNGKRTPRTGPEDKLIRAKFNLEPVWARHTCSAENMQ